MEKLFRLQDYLLLALAELGDVYDEVKDPLGALSKGYESMYGYVPKRFKKRQFAQTVYHNLTTGNIEKIIKNGKPYLRLTSAGQKLVQRDFSFLRFQNQKWDGKWWIVIFDIEEKEKADRDLLRRKLKELGFGMLQESVWLSPYDVLIDFKEFIESIGLEDKVYAMEVSQLLAGNPKNLVGKVWNLEKINLSYGELYQVLIKMRGRAKISTVEEKEIEMVRERYLEIVKTDPCLPKELLPEDWAGEKVKEMVRKLRN